MSERPCCICGRPVKTLGGVVYAGGDHLPGAGSSMQPNGLMLEIDGAVLPCHFDCIPQVAEHYGEPERHNPRDDAGPEESPDRDVDL